MTDLSFIINNFIPNHDIAERDKLKQIYLEMFLEVTLESVSDEDNTLKLHSILNKSPFYEKDNKIQLKTIASFISYLGSNGGFDFLLKVETLKHHLNIYSNNSAYYELVWASENIRKSWMNGGYTLFEYLVSPSELFDSNGCLRYVDSTYCSYENNDLILTVLHWLSTCEGQNYIKNVNSKFRELYYEKY